MKTLSAYAAVAFVLLVVMIAAPQSDARNRNFCGGSFTCNFVPVSWPGVARACGGDGEAACDSGAQCDAGTAPIPTNLTPNLPFTVTCPTIPVPCIGMTSYNIPDDNVATACYACGMGAGSGNAQLGCNIAGQQCQAGLDWIRPSDPQLFGPISNCPSYLPDDPSDVIYPATTYTYTVPVLGFGIDIPISAITRPMPTSAQIVSTAGICTIGQANALGGASRETWASAEQPASGPQTVFVIHGRGSNCASLSNTLDNGDLYERNHLTYCVEYAQENPDEANIRTVRILPVSQDESGEGPTQCLSDSSCSFDRTRPIFSVNASTLSVPAVAAALAEGIKSVPVIGDVTLVAHSQGGFVARALMHEHYDDLRWNGRRISNVLTLGHPYFVKEQDPQLYAPWLCSDDPDSNFDCAVGRWMMGWDNWLGTSPAGSIDNGDFPQVRWTAVAGDSIVGAITIESADGADCSMIFGGIDPATVVGDSSVPTQSSLGVDEFDFFPIDQVALDDSSLESGCGHSSACMLAARLARTDEEIPFAAPRALGTGALKFDGTQYVEGNSSAQNAALSVTGNQLTMEAWIQPRTNGSNGFFLSKNGEYQMFLNSGQIFYAIRNSTPGWVSRATGYSPEAGVWTHVVLSYDGSAARLYANGVPVFSETANGSIGDNTPNDDVFQIGSRGASTPFDGQIDEVRIWSRGLSSDEVTASLLDPSLVSTSELRGWWRFDERDGDTLLDSGPLSVDLSLTTAEPITTPQRRVGARAFARQDQAMYFDGVNDAIAVTDPAALTALEVDTALTMEAWVYQRGGGAVFNKEGEYQLSVLNDQIAFTLASGSPGWSTRLTGVSVPQAQWAHIAVTFDGAQARVYLNGVETYSEPASGSIGDFVTHTNEDELWIGGRQSASNGQWFRGVIDDVRVWNVVRSSADIAAAYTSLLTGDENGLVGYWPLNDFASDVAFDRSPTGAHGALGRSSRTMRPRAVRATVFDGYPAQIASDTDGDGLTDSDELLLFGTDPSLADTDGDDLDDGFELDLGLDPTNPDTDDDLASDGQEVNELGSDPLNADTDGDGSEDGVDNCAIVANAGQQDTDTDGYGNRCDADFDNSCAINIVDLGLMRLNFFGSNLLYDLNDDGVVNVQDLGLLKVAFFGAPGPSAIGDGC